MTEYELKVCGTCDSFSEQTDDIRTDADGICRRYPPQVVGDGDGGFYTVFPCVDKHEYCLEWRGAEE